MFIVVFAVNSTMGVILTGRPFFYVTIDILLIRVIMTVLFTIMIYNKLKD